MSKAKLMENKFFENIPADIISDMWHLVNLCDYTEFNKYILALTE